MKDGFVRCASATVDIKVADTDYNTANIQKMHCESAFPSMNIL